jgi:anti-anti-sigma factor
MTAFDAALDDVVRERRLTALCLYDHGHYTVEQIERMRAVHREELVASAAYDDGLLRITQTGVTAVRLAGEADHSNRPVIHKLITDTLDRALRSADAPTDIVLNLASLRFIDVAGAIALVHAAEEFPSSHRLVLGDVRPGVQRVLDRCGAPFATQLVVHEARQPPSRLPDVAEESPGAHPSRVRRADGAAGAGSWPEHGSRDGMDEEPRREPATEGAAG